MGCEGLAEEVLNGRGFCSAGVRRSLNATVSGGVKLGLFGFVLALGAPDERKMGVGLALFGFVWVCFWAGEFRIFVVTLCQIKGFESAGGGQDWVRFARKGRICRGLSPKTELGRFTIYDFRFTI
jgi:hypothetical protein